MMIKIIVIAGGIVAGSLVVLARELCKFSEEINPYREHRTEWTDYTDTEELIEQVDNLIAFEKELIEEYEERKNNE